MSCLPHVRGPRTHADASPPPPPGKDYRRLANLEANNGQERKDLYTDNWYGVAPACLTTVAPPPPTRARTRLCRDGAEYKGSKVNILTVIAAIAILAPLIGVLLAFQTYGVWWG